MKGIDTKVMNSLPESVKGKFLLSVGDTTTVLSFPASSPGQKKYETRVPYLHFRKHPVEAGLYVVTNIWMHPKATDPNEASSYCYTLRKVKQSRRWVPPKYGWGHERGVEKKYFNKDDLSSTEVRYNCLEWDQLLHEGKVETSVPFTRKKQFNLDEFKKDLGQVLYKHRASLVLQHEFHDEWDDGGTVTLVVMANNKKKQALKNSNDSYYGMGFAKFASLLSDNGFSQIAGGAVPGTEEDEWLISWKDGILVFYDSSVGLLNHATAYFNYLPVGDRAYRYGFSGSAVDRGDGKNVWYGNLDVREGLFQQLSTYSQEGVFLQKWIKQPWFYLLSHGDWKIPNYDVEEINQSRINRFPKHVQDAIKGTQ